MELGYEGLFPPKERFRRLGDVWEPYPAPTLPTTPFNKGVHKFSFSPAKFQSVRYSCANKFRLLFFLYKINRSLTTHTSTEYQLSSWPKYFVLSRSINRAKSLISSAICPKNKLGTSESFFGTSTGPTFSTIELKLC